MEAQKRHRLDPVPDQLLARAVRDPAFREAVLQRKGDKKDLDAYLRGEGFKELDPATYAVIKELDTGEVNRVLEEIDRRGGPEGDGLEVIAS